MVTAGLPLPGCDALPPPPLLLPPLESSPPQPATTTARATSASARTLLGRLLIVDSLLVVMVMESPKGSGPPCRRPRESEAGRSRSHGRAGARRRASRRAG